MNKNFIILQNFHFFSNNMSLKTYFQMFFKSNSWHPLTAHQQLFQNENFWTILNFFVPVFQKLLTRWDRVSSFIFWSLLSWQFRQESGNVNPLLHRSAKLMLLTMLADQTDSVTQLAGEFLRFFINDWNFQWFHLQWTQRTTMLDGWMHRWLFLWRRIHLERFWWSLHQAWRL